MSQNLYLRAFEYEDLSFINKIRNDNELFEYTLGNKFYISSIWDKSWIEDKIFNNSKQLYLMICSLELNQSIGYVAATNIDYINRKAELGGIIIAKEFAGNGYATKAANLFHKHLFEQLGLNMLYTYVREDHMASLRMSEKSGLKKEGLIRDFVYKNNQFHNAFILTLLKSDYEERHDIGEKEMSVL